MTKSQEESMCVVGLEYLGGRAGIRESCCLCVGGKGVRVESLF